MSQDRLEQQIELVQHQLEGLLCEENAVSLDDCREALKRISQTIADLADRSMRYRDLFEFAPDAYVVTDNRGRVQAVNQAAATLLGRSADMLQGAEFADWLTAEAGRIFGEMLSAFGQGETVQMREVWLRHDPEPLCVVLSGSAQRQHSRVIRLRWLLHNISDRKSAERQLQQRIEQEELIGAIARRIRLSLNPEEILGSAVDEVRQFLQADRVVVYRLDAGGSASVVAESVVNACNSILGIRIDPRLTESQSRYRQGGFLAIDDVSQVAAVSDIEALLKQQQVRAVLVAPILQEETLLGMLCAHQCVAPRQWRAAEAQLLQQLADQVAIAITQSERFQQAQQLNADLEQEVRKRTEEVERALNFESMLKRITDKVRDSLDESQILDAAVRELTLVLELSGCNAALYDLDQGISTIRYDYTNSIPTYQGRVAQMDRFPEIYSQLQHGLYFQFCSLMPNPSRGQVAMLACPIVVADPASSQGSDQAVLGDLWLINHKDYEFNDDEIRLVQQVANQCAIAIRQARLFQAAQAQVKELEKLNRLKDDFLSTVSHELRTPISNVKMAIHMLKNAPDETRRERYLKILETESAREAELINDLLDLQRLEVAAGPVTLETLSLQCWLPALIEPFKTRIAHRDQSLRVNCPDTLEPMTCDFGMLQRILAELVNNACKYTASDHKIILNVWQETDLTVFQLKNQAEIPTNELPHIFKKFYRIPDADPWKQGGTGLGLALVQKFVERLQGSIDVDSAQGWTTFTVRLTTQFKDEQFQAHGVVVED